MKSINPANFELIKEYKEHSEEQVLEIISKVDGTFHSWKTTDIQKRASLQNKLADLLEQKKEELGHLITSEMGKPLKQAIAEVEKCAWVCRYYAENAKEFLKIENVENDNFKEALVAYEPIGVVLAVMPWNFPLWQVFRFSAPNLMAGNVGVLKHASNVSGCALAIEELYKEAGYPSNVFRTLLIPGGRVESVIADKRVKAVTLTGSSGAGSAVAAAAGKYLKKSVLELGGNDAYIVLADADLDQALEACFNGRIQNAGQSCIAAKRFILHKDIYQEFRQKLQEKIKSAKVGNPMDTKTEMGPLSSKSIRDELIDQVKKSVKAGAKKSIVGEAPTDGGAYYPITVLENVAPGMPAFDDELFGPVFSLIEASSDDDAIELANQSEFGLGGAIFSRNSDYARSLALDKFESGSCFVNDFVKSDPRLPFGGIKNSGFGRELSHYGFYEFLNIKTVCIR